MRRFLPFSFAAALVVTLFAVAAFADVTTTKLSAPSVIVAVHFYPPTDGGIMPAQACGRTLYADGGQTPVTCWDVDNGGLPPGHSLNTAVRSISEGSGAARTFWMGKEGL